MTDAGTQLTPTEHGGGVRKRVVPSVATFVVAAVAIYLTAYLAIGIVQHVVMPILAVVVAGWLASQVWKLTGGGRGQGRDGRRPAGH